MQDTECATAAVQVHHSASSDSLVLAGVIDLEAARQLAAQAKGLAGGVRNVAIDWRQAEYVSAGALQVLLALGITFAGSGRRLQVGADNPAVRGFLELAGLSGHFATAEEHR